MRSPTNFTCGALTALGILTTGSAQAGTPTTLNLAPSGPWNINYDADVCQLARTFGSGKDQVLFQLLTYNMQPSYTVLLAGQRLALKRPLLIEDGPVKPKQKYLGAKPEESFKGKFVFQFGPDGAPQTSFPSAATVQINADPAPVPALIAGPLGLGGAIAEPDENGMQPKKLKAADVPLEEAVTWFQLRKPEGDTLKLATGSMAKPLAALRACSVDLVKSWGIAVDDPALAPVQFPIPKTSPGTWAVPSDFPASDLRARTNAIVRFRLMVDAEGKITSCKIQDATRSDSLAVKTCELMTQRGAFKPALNAAGQPVAGYYTNAIKWVVRR